MRWIFYSLLVINLVYVGFQLVGSLSPESASLNLSEPRHADDERLQLLAERPQPRSGGEAGVPSGSLCTVVGPWKNQERAEAGAVQLRAIGLSGSVRSLSVQKDRLNWVYLPPYAGRARALQVLRELQDHGIDSFVVKNGKDANAISLGYFSSAESAEGLRVKMRNAGYPAFVRETSRNVTEYWLYLSDSSVENNPDLKVFLEANQSLNLSKVSCR